MILNSFTTDEASKTHVFSAHQSRSVMDERSAQAESSTNLATNRKTSGCSAVKTSTP
jgi:hypothetical protein